MKRIRCAAVRLIFEGNSHGEIIKHLIKDLGLTTHISQNIQGFVTDDNEFVSREEAHKIACEAGQIKEEHKSGDILVSEDLKGEKNESVNDTDIVL